LVQRLINDRLTTRHDTGIKIKESQKWQ